MSKKRVRGKNHFKEEWLNDFDPNNDPLKEYIIKVSEFKAKCIWCTEEISVENSGKSALLRHSKSQKHCRVANLRKNRDRDQAVFVNPSENVDDPPPANNNDDEGDVTLVSGNQAEPSKPSNKGIMSYFTASKQTSHSSIVASTVNNNLSPSEKVAKAEILLILNSVYKNNSLHSLDTLSEVLKLCITDSKIVEKLSIGRSKSSYSLTDAIGPHFLNQVLKDIRKSEVYTIGIDTSTTKHCGLSKGLDLHVRYYSESRKQVCDSYISTTNLGHETGQILLETVVKMLSEAELDQSKVMAVSRDNPNVMKTFQTLFENKAKELGNLHVFQSPCTLHPCHTGFKKGIEKLKPNLNVDLFLVDIHSWFKLSTARREDFTELRLEMECEDFQQFFFRHVSSRWLTAGPTANRIINHWSSLKTYFEIIEKSKDQTQIEARKSDRYTRIYNVLKPSNEAQNLVRLYFVVFLSSRTELYLRTFQSSKPMAFKLYMDSCFLISTLMQSIVREEHIPMTLNGSLFLKVDLKDTKVLKISKQCDFGPNVHCAIRKLSDEDQTLLRRQFREAMVEMIKYLIAQLPLENKLLKQLSFTDPSMIDESKFSVAFQSFAKVSKRFSNDELQKLSNQLMLIKLTLSSSPSQFDESNETYDTFWLKKVLMKTRSLHAGEEFIEFEKVVKMISIYPNSQGFVERGFNITKRIADSRENVSENLMKASKVVFDHMRQVGGPSNVTISPELLVEHQRARQKYRERLEKEKRERELEAANTARMKEAESKKRKFEADSQSWEEKVKKLKSEIKVLQEAFKNDERNHSIALSNASKYENVTKKNAAIRSAMLAAENIKKNRLDLDDKQGILAKLMSKKPKM